MISGSCKYLCFTTLKVLLGIEVLLLLCLSSFGQTKPSSPNDVLSEYNKYVNTAPVQCFSAPDILLAYHAYVHTKQERVYTKLTYTRPNNQLMSWPDYPLTTTQIEQRNKQWEQDNKLSSIIAKDIITSILSKKKKVAVIPKF